MLRPLRLAIFLCLFVFGGCLEFDAQDITMRYDPKADRIDMLVVYRGLFVEHGSGATDDPYKNAFADLDKVLERGNSYFWCNWPFVIDLVKAGTPGAALTPYVDVENGGLFTDPKGVLCGYQFVRIRDVKEFLGKLNTMLELAMQAAVVGGVRGQKLDSDTRELVTEFLRSGEKMLRVEEGRIELRVPCSPKDFRTLLGQVESYTLSNMPDDILRTAATARRRAGGGEPADTSLQGVEVALGQAELRESLGKAAGWRFFWDNEFTIERGEELQVIGLGSKGSKELVVKKSSDGFYCDNLLVKLRERGDKIEDGMPDQELTRRFEAFRGRDAVLPPDLKALREKK
ncbi:MAG: hypothetical protein U1E73_05630 [Planctomycetota bacterium]